MLAVTVIRDDPRAFKEPLFVAGWEGFCLAQSPHRLRQTARDRRWETTWFLAVRGGATLGVLPVQRSRSGAPPVAFYDPATIAPSLAFQQPEAERDWRYVGGVKDLISGVTLAAGLSDRDCEGVRRALIREAFEQMDRDGGTPVSLYVRDAELACYQAALSDRIVTCQVAEDAVLDLPGGTLNEYVASLPARRRYRLRREWQDLASRGICAVEQPAAEVCEEAAILVAAGKQRHGTADHPRMAAIRLREWADSGADETLAMTLRGSDGDLLGAVFVGRFGTTVEVNELGLAEEVADRHLLFTELLVHAPMRYAIRHGCRRLALGLDSVQPKAQRGARIEPVWAVGVRAS